MVLLHVSSWSRIRWPKGFVGSSVLLAWAIATACVIVTWFVGILSSSGDGNVRFVEEVSSGGWLIIVLAISTLGAVLWVPAGLVYAFALLPLFQGEKMIAATPSRDATRRALWLSARWSLGMSFFVALVSRGGLHSVLLAFASGFAALVVLALDLVDLRFLSRVDNGLAQAYVLRALTAVDELAAARLIPFHGGLSSAPGRVLCARAATRGDGPFRSASGEWPLFTVGAADDVRRRVSWAALVALAGVGPTIAILFAR